MSIILNERKEAERRITENDIGIKPIETLNLIARYYRQIDKLSEKKTAEKLNEFMKNNHPSYNPVKWRDIINSLVKRSKKYPLTEINEVPITQSEINIIQTLPNTRLKKTMFALLCYAKFSNLRNNKNNNWVAKQHKELFKAANITITHKEQMLTLNSLMQLNMISFSKCIDNTNIKVEIVDTDGDAVWFINDFRNLGYEYVSRTGQRKYIRCADCGQLFMPTHFKNIYCKNCAGYQPIKVKKIKCCDCGRIIEINSMNEKTIRCDDCQRIHRNEYQRELMRKRRSR